MNPTVRIVPALAALVLGCGDPSGLRAQGNVTLTVRQAGQPDGSASMTFPPDTLIDPPPGVGRGFYGTCVRSAGRWMVDIARADSDPTGLRRVLLSVGEGTTASGVTAKFTLGSTEYNGTLECTASALPNRDKGVELTVRCTGLRASIDPRTVDASVSLSLARCDS
jgi:hypothetical protein